MTAEDFAEFGDIEPIPLPQKEGDAFYIVYPDIHVKLFGIFHALLEKQEISQRALNLCNTVVERYSKHYTAWSYKCDIMASVGYIFQEEVDRAHIILSRNPKCYQAWHFMEWLTNREPSAPDLVSFLSSILTIDAKNFHGWSFAIWYAERWHKERDIYSMAIQFIQSDCRNNSAWNARKTVGSMLGVDPHQEFDDAAQSLRSIGRNESACNFLLAIARENPDLLDRVSVVAKDMLAKQSDNACALRLLLAVTEDQGEIERMCDLLMDADRVRAPYYKLVKSGVVKYK